jgi:putative PIN family toxin of toxin-antitoxin system
MPSSSTLPPVDGNVSVSGGRKLPSVWDLRQKPTFSAYLKKCELKSRRKMIAVVADTNVYVSAIVFGGTCETVLALSRAGMVEFFSSPAIQKELKVILGLKFGWNEFQVREALAEFSALVSLVRPSFKLSGIVAHDQDHRILECALAARADFLVTGDKKHLQPLKNFRGIRIVSPRDLLTFFSELGSPSDIEAT